MASDPKPNLTQSTAQAETPNICTYANGWLSNWLPKTVCLSGDSLDSPHQNFEAAQDYVIHGTSPIDEGMLAITLAEKFARAGGHVIWVGTTSDLYRMSDELLFKIAGLELPTEGTEVQFDVIKYLDLMDARAEMMNMWIDFCNVEDCGDMAVEQDFVASMSSFKPTLIVVASSIFDDQTLDAFEFLIRNTSGLQMVKHLRETNPICNILWPSSVANSTLTTLPNLHDTQ